MKAVIDRFENGQAVLLLGKREQQLVVPRSVLPQEASEGSWLNIFFELDPEETEARKKKIQDLLQKLKGSTNQEM